jgi:hypothetical protein
MGVVTMDGRVAVGFVTSIAVLSAPTLTEVTTNSTRLETLITPDGLDISAATGKIDVGNLASVANGYRAGRITWDVKITFHHDGVTDTAWNLFPYRTSGFLWVRKGIDRNTAMASGNKLQVWAIETAEPNDASWKPEGVWDFTSEFFVTEIGYASRAVVA